MRLLDRLRNASEPERSYANGLTFEDVLSMFSFNGNTYQGISSPVQTTLSLFNHAVGRWV